MSLIKFLIKTAVLLAIAVVLLYIAVCIYFPVKHLDIIEKYSEEYGLDRAFVCAIIKTESNFNENAESRKGARGLMQLMPDTIDWAVTKIPVENFSYADIEKPEVNIKIGCWVLNYLNNQLNDERLTIAAYNAGIGNIKKWLNNSDYSLDGSSLYSIPYGETEKYVEKVELYKNIYTILLRYDFYDIKKIF
ncbi:MAG: lytic transglycosylase domain-containing protein [Lachnospirales bacterium]